MIKFGETTLTLDKVDTVIGANLDAVGSHFKLYRYTAESDVNFRRRVREAYMNHRDNDGSDSTPRRINWKEGLMFIKKGQEPDSTALYKVLHPGQPGGDVMFVVRLDTGEESLYSKDLQAVILANSDDVSDRMYRAEFALIVNRVQNGDLPMHAAFNQARQLFVD